MPYAGYGMNAGIADATNLAWLLAACCRAGPTRRSSMPMRRSGCRSPSRCRVSPWTWPARCSGQRRTVPDEIEQPGAEGDAVRQQVGQAAYDLNVQQYCCGGLNFGYFYDRSPIIAL